MVAALFNKVLYSDTQPFPQFNSFPWQPHRYFNTKPRDLAAPWHQVHQYQGLPWQKDLHIRNSKVPQYPWKAGLGAGQDSSIPQWQRSVEKGSPYTNKQALSNFFKLPYTDSYINSKSPNNYFRSPYTNSRSSFTYFRSPYNNYRSPITNYRSPHSNSRSSYMNSRLSYHNDSTINITSAATPKPPVIVYNHTLTYVFEGKNRIITDREKFIRFNGLLNRKIPDIVTEGKKAAKFFKKRFGLDFTKLSDESYVNGFHSDNQSGVIFNPYIFDSYGSYRLIQKNDNNHKRSKSYVYAPIVDFGWGLNFTKDFKPGGDFQNTDFMIPAGSTAVYGDYVIEIWRDKLYQPYSRLYWHTWVPKEIINIHFESNTVIFPAKTNPAAVIIDSGVTHKEWGLGNATGIILIGPGSNHLLPVGRNVLTF